MANQQQPPPLGTDHERAGGEVSRLQVHARKAIARLIEQRNQLLDHRAPLRLHPSVGLELRAEAPGLGAVAARATGKVAPHDRAQLSSAGSSSFVPPEPGETETIVSKSSVGKRAGLRCTGSKPPARPASAMMRRIGGGRSELPSTSAASESRSSTAGGGG